MEELLREVEEQGQRRGGNGAHERQRAGASVLRVNDRSTASHSLRGRDMRMVTLGTTWHPRQKSGAAGPYGTPSCIPLNGTVERLCRTSAYSLLTCIFGRDMNKAGYLAKRGGLGVDSSQGGLCPSTSQGGRIEGGRSNIV